MSAPLPDQYHRQRFDQLIITQHEPETHRLQVTVADLAAVYLRALDKLWQIPTNEFIREPYSILSDDRDYPLRVTFLPEPNTPWLLTTEHATWTMVRLLRQFRQDRTVTGQSFSFTAHNWAIRVANNIVGYVNTDWDYSEGGSSTAGLSATNVSRTDLLRNFNSTGLPAVNGEKFRQGIPMSTSNPLILNSSTILNGTVSKDDFESLPRPISVRVDYSRTQSFYPRDVADIFQFLSTIVMENAATDRIPDEPVHWEFEDDDTFSGKIVIGFVYSAAHARRSDLGRPTFSDLVFGLREILRRINKDNTYAMMRARILRDEAEIALLSVRLQGALVQDLNAFAGAVSEVS